MMMLMMMVMIYDNDDDYDYYYYYEIINKYRDQMHLLHFLLQKQGMKQA